MHSYRNSFKFLIETLYLFSIKTLYISIYYLTFRIPIMLFIYYLTFRISIKLFIYYLTFRISIKLFIYYLTFRVSIKLFTYYLTFRISIKLFIYYITVQKNFYFSRKLLSDTIINGAYKLRRFKSINRRIERFN